MEPITLISFLIQMGAVGFLYKIASELGCIKNELKHAAETLQDHGHRLERLEKHRD